MNASSPTGSGGPGPAPGSIEHANLRSLMGTTRTLTRVWLLLGVLVGLLSLLEIVFALFTLHFPGGGVSGLVYAALWVIVDLLVLARIDGWIAWLDGGRYSALKEPLLVWGILGFIFGIVPGLLLLWAYLHTLAWGDSGAPSPGKSPAPPPEGNPLPPVR